MWSPVVSPAVRLGADQEAVTSAHGPARVLGPTLTGKTTALRARFARLLGEAPPGGARVVAVAASERAAAVLAPQATTFPTLAAGIVERHAGRVDVLTPRAQRRVVAELLDAEGPGVWPTLGPDVGDPAFVDELATTVCAYQASFLGDEELCTHADAAGQLERWEELAAFTARYRRALAARDKTDWAGVLVAASLLVRRPDVLASERLAAAVVDDWQQATFATHRLLAQLTGPGGDVVVAGDHATHVAGRIGASPRYLQDFPRRFGAATDLELTELRAWPAAPEVAIADLGSEGSALAGAVAASGADVVLARDDAEAGRVARLLADEGMERCPVVAAEDAVSCHWDNVVLASCRREASPSPLPRWFDTELFGGPDLPDADERSRRAAREERAAWELAWTRALRRLTLVVLEEPGRGFPLPDGLA